MYSFRNIHTDGDAPSAPGKDFVRRQKPGAKKVGGGAAPYNRDGGGGGGGEEGAKRKTSLRIGTSRKGRGAELSSRRGSLKKKDRRADKAARAEAAIERKTVYLPEYVL